MRLSRSLPASLLALTLALLTACGGDDNGTDPTPPPPDVATVVLSLSETDLTVGETAQADVTVRDASGNELSGRTVTFSSSDDAVATVTSGGLVTATGRGSATITATSEGVSDTGEVSAAFATFEPEADTELGGENDFETLTVPDGVTVTLTEDAVLRVAGAATIAGDVVGDCRGLEVVAGGSVSVSGNVTNSCTEGSADVRIVSGADLTLSGSEITSSGNVEITNDPTLTDDDFDLAPGAAPASGRNLQGPVGPCRADGARFIPNPAARPEGQSGRTWVLSCNGDGVITGGTTVQGQSGGGGADGDVTGGEDDSNVEGEGGDGADAGRLDVRVTGNLDFPANAAVTFVLGDGGDGGSPTVTAQAPGGSATATGGNGGESGTLRVSANGGITIGPGGIIIQPGTPGSGGTGTAVAADGRDAGEAAAQPGGNATATGGTGGASPRARLRSRGSVTGLANVTVRDAPGGVGGDAHATGGKGGDGNEAFPDGAAGGSMTATAGPGGEAIATGTGDAPIGVGGMGGSAFIMNGIGGTGWNGCSVTPNKAGGNGGVGGDGAATSGVGGVGNLMNGDPGNVTSAAGAGDGGAGGDGAGPGGGGAGGAEALNANGGTVTDQNPNFAKGGDGNPCPGAPKPVSFLLNLANFISQPGTVAAGSYSVPISGEDFTGTLPLTTEGQIFWSDAGSAGPRFGYGTNGIITFDLTGAAIEGGEIAGAASFGACDSERSSNTTLSFEITPLGASGAPLASPAGGPIQVETDDDGCFNTSLPEDTKQVRVQYTGNGFIDILALAFVLAVIAAVAS